MDTEEIRTQTGDTAVPETGAAQGRRRRRGKYAYAAPLGVIMTLLAILGVAALVIGGIALVRRATDTSALEEELYYYLRPLMAYNPTPFEDITQNEQDAFLNAAAYRISLAEQIRMLRENDENCRYPVDEQGRIAISLEEMEESYNALFGPASPLTHRTLDENGLTFSDADDCYYVPFESLNSGYRAVMDKVTRRGKTYFVRIGYVANKDILLDEYGTEITPTAAMATYYQTYTVVRYADGYYVDGCADG